MKLLFKDLSTNPYTQYKVHMWGAIYWLINFPLVCCLFFFTPTLWLKLGIFITLIYSIYANLATDYGAMSAAEAAFGQPQPPPIPLEPPIVDMRRRKPPGATGRLYLDAWPGPTPGHGASLISGDLGSRDPVEERERRGDDRERGREPAGDGGPVRDSRDAERDADLGVEVEGSRHEADHDRHCGDQEEWQRTLQRDDTVQERGGDAGEPEQAERALPLAQPGGDVHGETAGGDDEARHDDHVGHVLDHRQEARGRRIEGIDCDRSALEGKVPFERGPGPFERAGRPVRGDDDCVNGKTRGTRHRHVRGRPDRRRRMRVVPEEVRKEVADARHRRSRSALADRRRLRQLVARDDPERVPRSSLGGLWWTSVTPRTAGVVRSSASTWPGTEGTCAEAGQFDVEKLQNGSARVSFPALPPPELLAAAMELSAPITALATKRAITSPLMNRKAALGLSRSRRPAMRVEGRLARLAMSRAPAVVNHGPASTSPTTRSTKPASSSRSWPPMSAGLPAASKYASTAMPASSGMIRAIRGGRDDARRFTPSGDIWTLRSARRADTTAATGTPITASTMSIECSERSPAASGAR